MTGKKFVFDWQKEGRNSFLHWFLPTVMVGTHDNGVMDELSEKTDKFTDVHLQILINGVEVNAEHFLESVEANIKAGAKDEARRMLDDVGGLDQLEDRINLIRQPLINKVENALAEMGIELPNSDDDWY